MPNEQRYCITRDQNIFKGFMGDLTLGTAALNALGRWSSIVNDRRFELEPEVDDAHVVVIVRVAAGDQSAGQDLDNELRKEGLKRSNC